MAYASYITGMAYSNVGLGLVHGMAHPLAAVWARGPRWATRYSAGPGHGIQQRTSPVRSTATSPMRSVLRTPTPATWRRCAKRAVQAVHKLTVDLKNPTTISGSGRHRG